MLGYKGLGGGERKGRDVDVSGTFGYGYIEFFDKLDGIADEESECVILVLIANLVTIYCEEDAYSLRSAHRRSSMLKRQPNPPAPVDS